MRMSRIVAPLLVLGAQLLPLADADAQLGFYTLPKDDFIWHWGDVREAQQRGMADIEISGSESFFRCDLTARMRVSSNRSSSDIRDIEMELRQRLDFIYAVSEAMNYLEYNRELSWATLDCKRQGDDDNASPEQRAERESAAREKMLRELERRRERQRDDN